MHHITYIKIHTGAAVLQKQKQNQNHSQSSPKFGNAIYQMFANVDPKYIKKHCEFRASLNAYYKYLKLKKKIKSTKFILWKWSRKLSNKILNKIFIIQLVWLVVAQFRKGLSSVNSVRLHFRESLISTYIYGPIQASVLSVAMYV